MEGTHERRGYGLCDVGDRHLYGGPLLARGGAVMSDRTFFYVGMALVGLTFILIGAV